MILADLVDPTLVGGYKYVAVHRDRNGKPYKYAAQVPSSLSKTRKQFQIMPMVDTAQAAAQQVVDYVNTPLTIEDIRNPARKSGFNHVNSASPSQASAGMSRVPDPRWRASSGTKGNGTSGIDYWRGSVRRTAEEAAQDYIDYINAQNPQQSKPSLKTAGHVYDIEHTERDPEVEAALGVLRDARAQREGKQGFVYCIGEEDYSPDSNYVKVGYSVNPQKRVAELQTGNPRKLVILAIMKGTLEDERALHAKYADANILQEWFELSDELLEEFQPADEVAGETNKEVTTA